MSPRSTERIGIQAAQPRMADVAALAGVSLKTVSRVVNGAPHVRSEIQDRVNQAILTLGYKPNAAARALASRTLMTIGAVLPATALYGPSSQLNSLQRAAMRHGYTLSVVFTDEEGPHDVTAGVNQLLDTGVAGLVIATTFTDVGLTRPNLESLPPVVFLGDRPFDDQGFPVIAIGHRSGSKAAVNHLLGLGHATVHHLAGPPTWMATRLREEAWRETLQEHGRAIPEPMVGDWSIRSGYEAGLRLLADPDVTALFVANDEMALGVLRAARVLDAPIPERLSIVGFDDTPHSAYSSPPLTTVRQDFESLAESAVQALLARLGGNESSSAHTTETELIIRDSTAPPRA